MAKDFADISHLTAASELNATNKRESVAKLMKAWESKNAKRALQGTALSTMAVTLAACGGSDSSTTTSTTPVDITTDNAAAVSTALKAAAQTLGVSGTATMTDAQLVTAIKEANDAAVRAGVDITTDNAAAVSNALRAAAADLGVTGTSLMTNNELFNAILQANDAAVRAGVDITADNAAAVSNALRTAATDLGVSGASNMTNAELINAIQAANDAAVRAGVDITTDNAAAGTAALRDAAANLGVSGTSTMSNAELINAIQAANDAAVRASVDITSDNAASNAAAVSSALRAAANDLGVTGTANMTDAQLIAAIVASNDATVAGNVDLTTDNATATDNAVAAANIAGVTTLAQLLAAYDALVNPAARTMTLTTNTDVGSAYTGGGEADTFVATLATLTVGDNLVGGAGVDTLNLTANLSNANVARSGFTTSGIEVFNVLVVDDSAGDDEAVILNMNSAPVTTLSVSGQSTAGASDAVTFNNVAAGTNVRITAQDVDTNVNYVAAATAGTSDSASVTFQDAIATGAGDASFTVGAGIETLTVASAGTANTVGSLVFGGTTINLSGAATMNVRTAIEGTVDVVNAGTMTGALTMATTNDTSTPDAQVAGVDVVDFTFTGGSGNDVLVSNNAANNEVNINMGAGNDQLTVVQILSNASSTTAGDVLAGGAGDDTLLGDIDLFDAVDGGFTGANALTGVTGFETLAISGFGTENNTLNVANISADISTVAVTTAIDGVTARALTINAAGSLTVNIGGAAAILDGDTLTVDSGAGTSDVLVINNSNAVTGTAQMGANDTQIVATDFETVSINTGSYATATSQQVNTINVGANTLNIVGANGLTTAGAITATTINASGATGALVMGAAAAAGVTTITGGSAADTLRGDAASTINGGAGNDQIFGGTGNDVLNGDAGDDTITTGTGNDAVSGGAGNDRFVFGADLSALDTISGGDGIDTVAVTNASITALQALNFSQTSVFQAGISGLERLEITDALDSTGDSFEIGYFTGINTVRLNDVNGAQVLTGLDSGDTLELTVTLAAAVTPTVTGAVTGGADVLNVALINTVGAADDFGDLTLANIETVNISTSEATANAADRGATIGLTLSQTTIAGGGSGAAQAVNFSGTESVTVDTAIAVGTINASGMTLAAATSAGLTMSTAATIAQTITGSGGVDTLIGASTASSTINGGAGNDTITGGAAADVINGGVGTDTFVFSSANVVEQAGASTTTGVVINLGATDLSASAVNTVTGAFLAGTQASVAANTATYLYNGESNTNVSVIDTLTSIENATGTNLADYIMGSAEANVITGGTLGDKITGGGGADVIRYIATTDGTAFDITANLTTDLTESSATALGAGDYVTDFVSGTDTVQIDGALEALLEAAGATVRITAAGWDYDAAGIVIVDNAVVTVADFGDASAVAAAIDTAAAGSANATDGDAFIVVLANTGNTAHGVYYFVDADATGDLGADVGDTLVLLGTLNMAAAADLSATSVVI